MGTPVPLRKPLETLVGITPDSCIRKIPQSRQRLGTQPGGFSAGEDLDIDIEIEIDIELEPEPANDVQFDVVTRSAFPPPPPSSIPAPPVSSYALPTAQEIREVQLDARRERIKGLALMVVSAATVLLILEILILAVL